jgi:low temperature requirement protein LtrA
MAFVFSLWSWYFDRADGAGERHVRSRKEQRIFSVWNYSHLPLFISIGAAGVGFKHLIALQAGEYLHHVEGIILFLAVGVSMIALTTIGASATRVPSLWQMVKRSSPQYLLAASVLVAGFHADHVHKAALAGLLVASCLGQNLLGGRKVAAVKQSTVSSPRTVSAMPNSQSA